MQNQTFLSGVEALLLEEFRTLGQARVDAINPQVLNTESLKGCLCIQCHIWPSQHNQK